MSLKSLTRTEIMDLADSIEIFHRGEDYCESGQIYQFSATNNHITAKIRGNYGNYTIKISQDSDDIHGLEWECSCPYDGDVCKHIVAVLLYNIKTDRRNKSRSDPDSVLDSDLPLALKQALEEMTHQDLLKTVLKLAEEQSDFRRALLANINISPKIINKQPKNPKLVKRLKSEISTFFTEIEYRERYDEYDYYHEYDEDEEYPELDSLFERAKTLNTIDQLEVFWHVVICGNDLLEEQEYSVGTEQIEQAINYYAEAISKLSLNHKEKQSYIDSILEACDWSINDYGKITEALKSALDKISSSADDYKYLIKKLEKHHFAKSEEWLADYYLKLGDDQNYLRIRNKNLQSEEQYLDLAHYWRSKGNNKKYLATLEEWITELPKRARQPYQFFISRPRSEGVLSLLAQHYQKQSDDKNLCRILMTTAQYGDFTLELYKQIATVSKKLKQWKEDQTTLINYAKNDSDLLAKIFLYEKDWDSAIRLAQGKAADSSVKSMIADGIKKIHPQEAIKIYQSLVKTRVEGKGREHYRIAAVYAASIKSIYLSILKDKKSWQSYIDNIRKTYHRYPALRDEFKNL
ncbi:MAG: SWIM zinc finger family protein [Acidobacteriota bacterium]